MARAATCCESGEPTLVMGADRSFSSSAMRAAWVLVAVLAAAEALTVSTGGGLDHRRRSPALSTIHEIDKQFAALGSHHLQQHQLQDATGVQPELHQPDAAHKSHKPHHTATKPLHHAVPKHHRVGPKSLRHDHEAQMASSDHVAKKSAGGSKSAGKTHAYSGAKTSGGGHGEHHHYEHNRGEDDKEHRARQYEEGKGAKTHYDHDDHHHSAHDQGGHGGHGAKHMEFNHHDKHGFSKGFRDKYHKDEAHKLDKFWSSGHEKGAYEKFGIHSSHNHNEDKGKMKKSQHKVGGKSGSYKKKGQLGKGHSHADSKAHKGQGGHESQHSHHEEYSKKGGSGSGKAHHFQHGKGKA